MDVTNIAAGGGLVAATTMLWSNIKNIYTKISSVIISRIEVKEGDLVSPVYHYLFHTWKQVPRVIPEFNARTEKMKSGKYVTAPFHIRNIEGFNYKKKSIVHLSSKDEGLVLSSIRGFNFKKFLYEAAIEYEQAMIELDTNEYSRYYVHDIVGRDTEGYKNGEDPQNPIAQRGISSSGNSLLRWCNENSYSKYGSFVYSKEHMKNEEPSPWNNLYLESNVLDCIDQISKWKSMQTWYQDRGIPWRRGLLMHGPGGSGKSSLAKAIAQHLSWPIFKFNLNTLSDQEFISRIKNCYYSFPAVILFEDFDTVFDGRNSLSKAKSLSFDCVLNAISGVDSRDGMFLIITTNDLSKIDPAIGIASEYGKISTRPGRIDTVLKLDYISKLNREKMAFNTLRDWPELIDDVVVEGEGMTPAQYQELLIQQAFQAIKH